MYAPCTTSKSDVLQEHGEKRKAATPFYSFPSLHPPPPHVLCSVSHSVPLSFLTIPLIPYFTIFLFLFLFSLLQLSLHSHSFTLSLFTLSHLHAFTLSLFHTFTLSHFHSFTLSFFYTFFLSHSLSFSLSSLSLFSFSFPPFSPSLFLSSSLSLLLTPTRPGPSLPRLKFKPPRVNPPTSDTARTTTTTENKTPLSLSLPHLPPLPTTTP